KSPDYPAKQPKLTTEQKPHSVYLPLMRVESVRTRTTSPSRPPPAQQTARGSAVRIAKLCMHAITPLLSRLSRAAPRAESGLVRSGVELI
ncbi:hypothetical protein BaRGS_00028745, partial [Batillaria attramentaria]